VNGPGAWSRVRHRAYISIFASRSSAWCRIRHSGTAGSRGEPHPGRTDAAYDDAFAFARLTRRERDDALRSIRLFQAAENLGLLRRKPLGRERRVSLVDGDRSHLVEPAAERDRPFRADFAAIQVRGSIAAETQFREHAFGQMPAANQNVNEPHE